MNILLDTNILARYLEPGQAKYQAAIDSVALLRERGHDLCLVPQNLYELWVVCTRPTEQNGFGMTSGQAEVELARFKLIFLFLVDSPQLFLEWERLVVQHQITGKNAHDARLVAAMMVHGVGQLLTFNVQDFKRYSGITILNPDEVLADAGKSPSS